MTVTMNAPGFWNLPDNVIARKAPEGVPNDPAVPYGDDTYSFYPQGTPLTVPNSAQPYAQGSGVGPPGSPDQFFRDTINDVGVGVNGGTVMRNTSEGGYPDDPVLLDAMRDWVRRNQPFPSRMRR